MRSTISILTALYIFSSLAVSAQTRFGLSAGFNLTTVKGQYPYRQETDKKLTPGWNVGVTADIPVTQKFFLQTGILFSTKGYRSDHNTLVVDGTVVYEGGKEKFRAYYLEIPATVVYKQSLGFGRLVLGLGPYIAYGLNGKWETTNQGSPPYLYGDLEFVNDYKDRAPVVQKEVYGKPLDFGVNALVGYELTRNLSIQLNGQTGLVDLTPTDNGQKPATGRPLKNRGLGLAVAYKF